MVFAEGWGGCGGFLKWDTNEVCLTDSSFHERLLYIIWYSLVKFIFVLEDNCFTEFCCFLCWPALPKEFLKTEGKWYQMEIYIYTKEWRASEMVTTWVNINIVLIVWISLKDHQRFKIRISMNHATSNIFKFKYMTTTTQKWNKNIFWLGEICYKLMISIIQRALKGQGKKNGTAIGKHEKCRFS